jgi:monovalent cation:H+ antiporter, CPA1 family
VSLNHVVEYIIWMLIAASIIAVLAARLRIPYTVALVLGGLALGSVRLPILWELTSRRPDWLTPDVALILFLPPLLFEGSLKLQARHLRENLTPILLLSNAGVLVATFITGLAVHWAGGLPIQAALIFGAIVAATDPISVLAIFRDMSLDKRLSVIVEGESLLNDGTAAVLFGILVAGVSTGTLSLQSAVQDFLVVVLGGAALGLGLGYLISKITARIDEPQIEITLTTILAYGSYLAAESLHLSGVIATVAAGLMIGNFGARVGMSPRTRVALWSFWEYMSFVINSIVFLLIGLQVRIWDLIHAWQPTIIAIGAVLLGRMLSIYTLTPVSNLFSERIPPRWRHLMVWGGLRGALSLALALSLGNSFPYRDQILAMTFGTVAFTIIVQGLSIKQVIRMLGIMSPGEDELNRTRVRKMAVSSARAELDGMLNSYLISQPAYEKLSQELDGRLAQLDAEISEIQDKDESRITREIKAARIRLITAEKSSIEHALHDGLITAKTASALSEAADQDLDALQAP